MNRVKNAQLITDRRSEEHMIMTTMQDLSSTVSFSPSFSIYASSDLVEAAVRVVRESESYYSVKVDSVNDKEFEFETSPLRDESFFRFPTTAFKFSSDDDDVGADRVITSKDIFYGGWSIDPPISSPTESHSSSESDDLEKVSPSRCFWSPTRSPAIGDGLKMKSKSSSEPRRCRIREFLRRSHSDGAVSTSSASSKRCSFKDLLRRSHSDGGGGGEGSSSSSSGKGSPVVKGSKKTKTVSYKPEMVQRRKSYLPYRQDLIGVFAGMSRFRH
ncbi:hypothetical protein CARUB_v10001703mg [Capsella rubella]|uniref:Uncharacterized protein n=1 Tax=Capsella rubella TaxID=81985 RepID=R0H8T3_9BRAS|nr:uncharacterized protein LOC17883503 [Capsella rubella]EOA21340.1 hypothetical protein CARUB_v10001703mg [Capsella rubella]